MFSLKEKQLTYTTFGIMFNVFYEQLRNRFATN